MDLIPGFAPAIVVQNDDPKGTGRIKVSIPGKLEETPYWVCPANWATAGVESGSRYPPPGIGSIVSVIFAYGVYASPTSQACYLTGYYGEMTDGSPAGPPSVAAAGSAEASNKIACIWEDDVFRVMIHNDASTSDKRILLQSKVGGSRIELNAADGSSGKAETITLEARTAIIIYSQGLIDIDSESQVKICGRPVSKLTDTEI